MHHELSWFRDGSHRAEYERLLSKVHRQRGPYWRSFLYVLAATGYGRDAEPYVDFETECVDPDLLARLGGAPTGGEERMIRTAMHLWNDSNPWTVMDLRGLDRGNLKVCIVGIEHLVSNIG